MPSFVESWLDGPNSTSFYTRQYIPSSATYPNPKGALVFVHGFIEHVGRYEHVHLAWAARGFVVFTFDQRGFGKTALDVNKKSKGSSYGKTSGPERMGDVQWAVRHVKATFEDVPIFLMGHSMGGGIVLGFPTNSDTPPDKETVSLLSGVISSSPLLRLSNPPLSFVRWVGGKACAVIPNFMIPASVQPEYLSHDPIIAEENTKDPLIKRSATLRAIDNMLSRGENLVTQNYKNWPKDLPLLIVHGTDDRVCSVKASEEFYGKVDASDKHLALYQDGYHELFNEPDGVKEKFFDECISWAEARIPPAAISTTSTSAVTPQPAEYSSVTTSPRL
ncbi:hypothetical protein EW146_g6476 [Bondarzewia mesenterica]|uniref:Serine aminopeptidase S33 domain-containing protein n=1 Tax=Bondarzewia mesenterica TaxID=1095465 RepID=A0A4S4LU47_9AGAM|nr:hypothetical protein EW146_g6476 [Bondarzewia mesenterica]